MKKQRADGTLVRYVPAYRRIMPYMMPTRNESTIFWEQTLDLTKTDAFVRGFNESRPDTQITPIHVLRWSAVKGFEKYPNLNRFVAGGGLYQRDGIWLSYSAQRSPTRAHRSWPSSVGSDRRTRSSRWSPRCRRSCATNASVARAASTRSSTSC